MIEDGDVLDGKTVLNLSLQNQDSLDSGEVMYEALFEDRTSGVYTALLP